MAKQQSTDTPHTVWAVQARLRACVNELMRPCVCVREQFIIFYAFLLVGFGFLYLMIRSTARCVTYILQTKNMPPNTPHIRHSRQAGYKKRVAVPGSLPQQAASQAVILQQLMLLHPAVL